MTLQELLAKKAELENQIVTMQREERASAIAKILEIMATHGLSLSDITARSGTARPSKLAGAKVATKYRDPQSGQAWTGRGLRPKWLAEAIAAGKPLEEFAV